MNSTQLIEKLNTKHNAAHPFKMQSVGNLIQIVRTNKFGAPLTTVATFQKHEDAVKAVRKLNGYSN